MVILVQNPIVGSVLSLNSKPMWKLDWARYPQNTDFERVKWENDPQVFDVSSGDMENQLNSAIATWYHWQLALPSGKLTVCYWHWPFIVDLPIKNGDFPSLYYVGLPERNSYGSGPPRRGWGCPGVTSGCPKCPVAESCRRHGGIDGQTLQNYTGYHQFMDQLTTF